MPWKFQVDIQKHEDGKAKTKPTKKTNKKKETKKKMKKKKRISKKKAEKSCFDEKPRMTSFSDVM